MLQKGTFVIVDGIAGSGKSTILKATQRWFTEAGARIFNATEWSQENSMPPVFADTQDADVLFTSEPTRVWIGQAIREELSQIEKHYSAKSLAYAFALDREIMYQRLIIPALEAGKTIIQDRGISSSIVYQPIMDDTIDLSELLDLPGNKIAMQRVPDYLILPQISATQAFERSNARKESKGVFSEELHRLETWNDRFSANWFRELFTEKGTSIHEIATNKNLHQTLKDAKKLFTQLFKL